MMKLPRLQKTLLSIAKYRGKISNEGVVKCRVDFAAADAYPPHIFFEALGGHIEDGGVIYTRLRDQDLGVFNEVLERLWY